MMLRRNNTRRIGATLVETAVVLPVVFLIVLGIVQLGIGVFRYQQVAHAAREASRWASVHGEQYAKEQGATAATEQDIYDNVIAPQTRTMSPENVTYTVTWNRKADGNWDKRPTRVIQVTDPTTRQVRAVAASNTVSVTVTYTWNTGLFGTFPVSSTSVSTISY
ncbi:MAG TPA: TadE/TadG family type IV pilus assembly protein [Gemmataceae bacterium]|nr:TadE/TadG family type IV pilus assembly protein [Gemmataceae bacterium]